MKFAFLLGGLLGFGATFGIALLVGKPVGLAMREACIGSIIAGFLFRWLGTIWIRSVKEMLMEKHRGAVAAMAEAEERNEEEAKEPVAKPV